MMWRGCGDDMNLELHHELVKPFGKGIQHMKKTFDSFPLAPLYVILLFASCFWLKFMTMNVEDDRSKRMSTDVNNMITVFIMFGTICGDEVGFHALDKMDGFRPSGEVMLSLE